MTKRKSLIAALAFVLMLSLTLIFGVTLTCGTLTAQAEDVPSYVSVNGHDLYDGYYLESNAVTEMSTDAETEPANYVAWYKNGVLTLNGYNGGQISVGGDLTIRLKGNNTITTGSVGIFVSSCENLTIDADSEETLNINVSSTVSDVFGISVGYAPGTTGNVTITGKSKVNIVCQTKNYMAFGIYSKYVTGIAGEASLGVKCVSEKITTGDGDSYGIYSNQTPVFNTSGTIKIDTSECATASYCVYSAEKVFDLQNGDCLLKYKKAASRSFASYPTIVNAPEGYVMRTSLKDGETVLKQGIARTVTVENGTDYYEKNENQYVEGEIVSVKTSVDGLTFVKWAGEGVKFDDATQKETTFEMLNKDVTVRAVYDVFAKQPVFERTGENQGSLSVRLNKEISGGRSITLINASGKVNSMCFFSLDKSTEDYTYKCKDIYDSDYSVPAGEYRMCVNYNGGYYFYSEPFEVDYTDKTPAASISDVVIRGKRGREIAPVRFDVMLSYATFKEISEGTDVSSWFSSLPNGLVAKISAVSKGATSATITISGTPTATSTNAIYLNIPKEYLATGNDNVIKTKYNSNAKFSIANPKSYSVIVTDGKAQVGDKTQTSIAEGSTVTIIANDKTGYVFDKWVVVSGGVTLADENSITTKFVMPENDVKIQATYKKVVSSIDAFVTAPVKDNTADTTTMTVNGTGYSATKVEWYKGEGVVSSMLMDGADKFVAGERYTVVVTLTVNLGYVFAGDSALSKSINGQAATLNSGSGTDTITIKATFTIAADPIPQYRVTVENGTLEGGATTGIFAKGSSVTVTANAPAADMVFERWAATGFSISSEQRFSSTITITVGNNDITLTAMYKAAPKYTVTVENGKLADGTTSGSFKAGESVTIKADAKDGFKFNKWTATGISLTSEQLSSATITITVGTNNIALTATYEEVVMPAPKYKVTVENGSADGDEFKMGQVVTITANTAPEGMVFDKWVVVSGGVTFEDANNATTTFIMPSGAVEIKATYKDKTPSGGGTDNPGGETPGTDDPSGELTPTENNGLSGGAITGIVVGSVAVAGVGGFAIFWFAVKKKSFADIIALFKKK